VSKKTVIYLIASIILIDQFLKFYIKLNYYYGQETPVFGNWFKLYFVENEGMAWGWKFGGEVGKLLLTLFRLAAVIWGTFLLKDFIAKKMHKGFIICAALIYAGALGNLIDSMFYGLIFDTSYNVGNAKNAYVVANAFAGKGYGSFLHGKVVDMLHFPLFEFTFPNWFPIWGGEHTVFFSPIFNIADASITIGVIAIFIFQKRFFGSHQPQKTSTVETNINVTDVAQVM
jgi:signal peptidase II